MYSLIYLWDIFFHPVKCYCVYCIIWCTEEFLFFKISVCLLQCSIHIMTAYKNSVCGFR